MGGTGRAAPETVEFQYQVPYGYATPPQQYAMQARAYMHEYGVRRRRPRPGRDQPAQLRHAEPAGHDAHAADDGGLPGLAVDRRTAAALRLLPGDRRRRRHRRDDDGAGPRAGPAARS